MSDKVEFIVAWKAKFSIAFLCRCLKMSRSAYYNHKARGKSARATQDEVIAAQVKDIWKESREAYGVPRVHMKLQEAGVHIGKNRLCRLYRAVGCVSKHTRSYKHPSSKTSGTAGNTLDRKLNPEAPDKVWATDITYLRVWGKWVYLCVFIDLYNREVVSWKVSSNVDAQLAVDTLEQALRRRGWPEDVLVHSDQGSTYTAEAFTGSLKDSKLRQSMSRRGNCWDNSCVESFFKTLKTELDHNNWGSPESLEMELFSYIDGFYNTHRIHTTLGTSPRLFARSKSMCTVGV